MEYHMDIFQRIGVYSATYFWRPNTILTVIWSLVIFVAFLKLRMPHIKWMNRLASTTLGIYMFHDGRLAGPIWKLLFKNATYTNSPYLIVHMLVAVLIVFFIGAVIDFIRQLIAKVFLTFIENIYKFLF